MDEITHEARKIRKAYKAPELTIYGDLKGIVKNFTINLTGEQVGTGKCNKGADTTKPCYHGG